MCIDTKTSFLKQWHFLALPLLRFSQSSALSHQPKVTLSERLLYVRSKYVPLSLPGLFHFPFHSTSFSSSLHVPVSQCLKTGPCPTMIKGGWLLNSGKMIVWTLFWLSALLVSQQEQWILIAHFYIPAPSPLKEQRKNMTHLYAGYKRLHIERPINRLKVKG